MSLCNEIQTIILLSASAALTTISQSLKIILNALGNHGLVLIEGRYSKYPYGYFAFTWEKYAI